MSTRVRISGTLFPALLLLLSAVAWLHPGPAQAQEPELATGQLVYVPAYGHIYHGSLKKPFYLTMTLSVRNVSPSASITVTSIDYFDTGGQHLDSYLKTPATLAPLETLEVVIEEKSESQGSGDNFLVRWEADAPVNPPLVETVMIGTASAQGISFTSRGVVIQD